MSSYVLYVLLGPVFAEHPVDTARGAKFLDQWARPLDFSIAEPPKLEDYSRCLEEAKYSAPGGDGLPYCAWHAAGIEGARTLYTLGETLYAGFPTPFGFIDSVTCFPPKGDDAEDVNQCTRAAEDTRPLSLKNSDNKTICSVMNRKSNKNPLSFHVSSSAWFCPWPSTCGKRDGLRYLRTHLRHGCVGPHRERQIDLPTPCVF